MQGQLFNNQFYNTKGLQLGMPYMGSKRKLAKTILDWIFMQNPNCKYFYDLFGGGGAMSFEVLQRPYIKQAHYNEFNAGVVELLKDVVKNGVTEKYYRWVSREKFNNHKNDDDWFGGLCKVVWSFGNGQTTYLFGRDIENDKHLLHKIVVNLDTDSVNQFKEKYSLDLSEFLKIDAMHERRKKIIRYIIKNKNKRLELERLQQLEQLERLNITNLSYEQVKIDTPVDETLIYLDPPYKNTKKYELDIDFDKLEQWVLNSKYKIYISSYKWDLPCVKEFKHRSILSANSNKEVIEKLFCNK